MIPMLAATLLAMAADERPASEPWRNKLLSFVDEIADLARELVDRSFEQQAWTALQNEIDLTWGDANQLTATIGTTAPHLARHSFLMLRKFMVSDVDASNLRERMAYGTRLLEQATALAKALRGKSRVWPENGPQSDEVWNHRYSRACERAPDTGSVQDRMLDAAKQAAYETRVLQLMYLSPKKDGSGLWVSANDDEGAMALVIDGVEVARTEPRVYELSPEERRDHLVKMAKEVDL
jgi:hypothetical protein